MDSYFTFFLCSLKWTETDRIFRFVDWLVGKLPLREKLHLIVRQKESAIKRKPTVSGDFFKFRHLLPELPLAGFSLSNSKWPAETTELFVTFENVRYMYAYSGPQPRQIEMSTGVKIFSFSVRKDIWGECERNRASLELLDNLETLFSAINCIYGYGDASVPLIPGGLALIGNREGTRRIRIVDFDYTSFIEKIYQYNYLSTRLLAQTANPAGLRDANDHFQYKDLHDSSDQVKGAAIYLKKFSSATIRQLTELLGGVIGSPTS